MHDEESGPFVDEEEPVAGLNVAPDVEEPVHDGFVKYDQGKPRFDLIPAEAELEVAKVLAYGATKYSPHNWRKGFEHSRYRAALARHLNAYDMGEDLDPETGFLHLAHARCCLDFLIASQVSHIGIDDRPSARGVR